MVFLINSFLGKTTVGIWKITLHKTNLNVNNSLLPNFVLEFLVTHRKISTLFEV